MNSKEIREQQQFIKESYQNIRNAEAKIDKIRLDFLKKKGVSYHDSSKGLVKVLGINSLGNLEYLAIYTNNLEYDNVLEIQSNYEISGKIAEFMKSLGDEITQQEFYDKLQLRLRTVLQE